MCKKNCPGTWCARSLPRLECSGLRIDSKIRCSVRKFCVIFSRPLTALSFSSFGGFEQIKLYLVDEHGNLSGSGKLLAGLGAGVLEAVFAVTPMETVKVKFINDQRSANPKFKGFAHGVGTIIKQEGFSGIYKGVTATIMKQGSNQAIRFYVMESLREWYKGGDKNKETPKLLVGLFGAVAGAASVFGK